MLPACAVYDIFVASRIDLSSWLQLGGADDDAESSQAGNEACLTLTFCFHCKNVSSSIILFVTLLLCHADTPGSAQATPKAESKGNKRSGAKGSTPSKRRGAETLGLPSALVWRVVRQKNLACPITR